MKVTRIMVIGLMLAISTICLGQHDYGYEEALIITIDSDTISCLVPLSSSFGKQFKIKRGNNEQEDWMEVSKVKYLATAYNVYENITFVKRKKEVQRLMQLLEVGKITLYLEVNMDAGTTAKSSSVGSFSGSHTTPVLTYVLKKDNKTYHVTKKRFSEVVVPLIDDSPEIMKKFKSKVFNMKLDNLQTIVNSYNSEQ